RVASDLEAALAEDLRAHAQARALVEDDPEAAAELDAVLDVHAGLAAVEEASTDGCAQRRRETAQPPERVRRRQPAREAVVGDREHDPCRPTRGPGERNGQASLPLPARGAERARTSQATCRPGPGAPRDGPEEKFSPERARARSARGSG